jgi:hypothetical protein
VPIWREGATEIVHDSSATGIRIGFLRWRNLSSQENRQNTLWRDSMRYCHDARLARLFCLRRQFTVGKCASSAHKGGRQQQKSVASLCLVVWWIDGHGQARKNFLPVPCTIATGKK